MNKHTVAFPCRHAFFEMRDSAGSKAEGDLITWHAADGHGVGLLVSGGGLLSLLGHEQHVLLQPLDRHDQPLHLLGEND